MTANLNQTNLDITDANLKEVFADLQGNIVKSHGRDHSTHVFLKFTAAPEACRAFVRGVAGGVTSATQQYQDARGHEENGSLHLFTSFFLTATGYRALGVDEADIPADKAFRAGMKDLDIEYDTAPRGDHRPTANPLNDNLDDWEEPFQQDIDALIIFAYGGKDLSDEQARVHLDENVENLRGKFKGVGDIILVQNGHVIRNERGQVIEHFGYVDGVSNPKFLKYDLDEEFAKGGYSKYDGGAPLGIVLVQDPGGNSVSFGTYFAYRKLQQNIKGFKDLVKALAGAMSEAGGEPISEDLAGAMAIGRFKDGTPVVELPTDGWTNLFNNFNYDEDTEARRCPFHSHARKTNPRNDTVRQFGSPPTIERSRRIVRRGIGYGSTDLNPDQEWTEAGLLFLSAQSDIEQQFIFMQNTWCNNERFLRSGTGVDPIIGQPRPGTEPAPQKWPAKWSIPGDPVEFEFSSVVRTQGGEYFFAPCISFLKSL